MRFIDSIGNTCCTVAMLLALAAPAFSQTTATRVQPASGSSGVPQEGIKVHGDWTLTVSNPDGTVAAVHEFKNGLSVGVGADRRLASLLGGDVVPGKWVVGFAVTPSDACGTGTGGCHIAEPPLSFGQSTNLTKTIPTVGPDAGKLMLRGSVRMVSAASISIVFTQMTVCAAATPPDTCVGSNVAEFTRKLLTQVIPVSAEQLVEVKVVISFS